MAILENRQDKISPRMSGLITGLYEDWVRLNERIETIAGEIETIGDNGVTILIGVASRR